MTKYSKSYKIEIVQYGSYYDIFPINDTGIYTARKAFRLPPPVVFVSSVLPSSALSSSLSPLDSSSDSSSFWGSEEVTFAVSSCACLTFFFGLLRLQLLRGLHCDCCVFLALLGEPAQTSTQSSKGGRTWL